MIKTRRRILPRSRKGKVVLLLVVVLLIAVGSWAWWATHQKTNKTGTTADGGYVNLNPPTEEELQETESHKKDLENTTTTTPATDSNGKQVVAPVVTNVQAAEVNGYIPGVFEEGGSCSVKLTNGSASISGTSKGFKNVSYTQCEPIMLSPPLSNGTWSVTLSYSSNKAAGSSTAKDFTVK